MGRNIMILLYFMILWCSINAYSIKKEIIELNNNTHGIDINGTNYKNGLTPFTREIGKLEEPKNVLRIRFHFFPVFNRRLPFENGTAGSCLQSSSDDFPRDLFSIEARRKGAIVLHFILGVYCFILLAIVCNDYFLPAIEIICERLNLSQDVAAATFMAIGTSAPEFFVNMVGTFVTESDIGVGTIVGSSMFNTLGVAALGGLACKNYIQLDWWPITRDSIIYILTITSLIIISQDKVVYWYEAGILLILYILYFIIMWKNVQIHNFILKLCNFWRKKQQLSKKVSKSQTISSINIISLKEFGCVNRVEIPEEKSTEESTACEEEEQYSPWKIPHGNGIIKFWWLFSWPVRLILKLTIPDCRRRKSLYPLTFIMCMIWIGSNSYLVSWMISAIGATFRIPDFIMGVTFLAAGGCLPEAISIVIVARKGNGSMGVSNSLGANTLDILLCMGLPWFIKIMVNWSSNEPNYIELDSESLFYTIIALILTVFVLYVTVSMSGYRLSKKVGAVLIIMYGVFLTTAIVLEMFLYYEGKLVPCD